MDDTRKPLSAKDLSAPAASGADRQTLTDASEAATAQAWVPIEYRQLSPGRFSGQMQSLELSNLALFHERHDQDVHKTGALPPKQCTVSLIDRGHRAARFSQFPIDGPDVLFFQAERHEFDIVIPRGRATIYAHLEQVELVRGLAALDEPLAERLADSRGLQSLGPSGKTGLEQTMHALLGIAQDPGLGRGGADPVLLRRKLMDQILLAIVACQDPLAGNASQLHARRRSCQIVRTAREFMEAQLDEGITPGMVDLCAHTGVSERTLRNAFHDQLGHPPSAYLRLLRLNRIRADPLTATPSTSVSSVAIRWGFLHLGRFAQDYRRLFQETPSATLSHARRP